MVVTHRACVPGMGAVAELRIVMATVRTNGAAWNDQSPAFYAASYVQLDDSASAQGYEHDRRTFPRRQFYTRTTKLVTGVELNGPTSGKLNGALCPWPSPGSLIRRAGRLDTLQDPMSIRRIRERPNGSAGNGWGLHSGTAISGLAVTGGSLAATPPHRFSVAAGSRWHQWTRPAEAGWGEGVGWAALYGGQ